jgi:hypothetical protein
MQGISCYEDRFLGRYPVLGSGSFVEFGEKSAETNLLQCRMDTQFFESPYHRSTTLPASHHVARFSSGDCDLNKAQPKRA